MVRWQLHLVPITSAVISVFITTLFPAANRPNAIDVNYVPDYVEVDPCQLSTSKSG